MVRIIMPLIRCAVGACLLMAPFGVSARQKTPSKPPVPTTSKPVVLDAELQAALKAAPSADKNPDAASIRLLDLGSVVVKQDGVVVGTYRESMKLLNERGRDLAEVSIPYNSSYQTVKILQARTIRRDGTVLSVKPEDIRTSASYGDYLMYDDAVAIGFSMPGVEDDCVLDYTYQLTTLPTLMPGQFWAYWGFNDLHPVVQSRYSITVPESKPFRYHVYNDTTLKPEVKQANGSKTFTWERRDLKPIEREPAMPPIREVRIWMELTSLNRWDDIASWFWSLARSQMTATQPIKETVQKLTTGKTTPLEKARAIYDWVANKTRYVGLEFGISAYKPHAAADVHKNLYGDCKDKSILLVTMLQLAGIQATPVLLKAGEPGTISSDLPTLTAFNHCITLADVEGKTYWLDATAETTAFGDIPESDRGCEGFVVREGKGEFKTIPRYLPEENGVRMRGTLTLNPEGGATAEVEIAMHGATGQQMRAVVRSLAPSKRKDMMQQLMLRFFPSGKLENYTLPDGVDKQGPYTMRLQMKTSDYSEPAGNLLLVPLAFGNNGNQQAHPFVKESRTYPILQNEVTLHRAEVQIKLPKGYIISDMPKNLALDSDIQSFHRTYQKTEEGKSLLLTEVIEERPGKVLPDRYPLVQSYFNTLVRLNKTRLVLREENR